jgi:Terpene cyclase DEP1
MARKSAPVPVVAWIYLLLALVGLASTMTYNVMAFRELGSVFTPAAFIRAGFEGGPILGSLASDFWVGSTASIIWMFMESRRLGMRNLWVYVALTFGLAWAFGLPLFLYMRERQMARGTQTARYAAARLAGRRIDLA